jgi:hypothetical protein
MADGFDVNVNELRQHAQTVANIANLVNAACRVAQGNPSGNAYGVIGQFFAAAILSACGNVRDGIMKGAQSFMDVQNGLKAVADLYQQVDQAHAELLRLTGGETQK